jgi:hypothetical protein
MGELEQVKQEKDQKESELEDTKIAMEELRLQIAEDEEKHAAELDQARKQLND